MTKKIMSWGTFMCDIIATGLDKVAEPGVIEYLSEGIQLRLGGHPVDVIIDLAQIGADQSQIGFASAVGDDVFGDYLMGEIARYRFQSFVQRVKGGTGKTMILSVKGKDRMCHLDTGACMKMTLEHLEGVLLETRPEFFTFRPGYTSLDTQLPAMLRRLRQGPLKDSFLLLDFCAPYKKEWSYYLDLIPLVNAVHGNSKEIIRATGEADFPSATKKALSLGAEAVLLTKEDQGAEIVTRRMRVSQPSFKIRFVEPSGCGDAFCAGVVYSLMRNSKWVCDMGRDDLGEALLWGQALGASAATEVGCVAGVTQANVERLLKEQGAAVKGATQVEAL